VTDHRITYEGPASLATGAATLLADSEGVELTSADAPAPLDGHPDSVRLALTVAGTPEAVSDAVRVVAQGLPAGAALTMAEAV